MAGLGRRGLLPGVLPDGGEVGASLRGAWSRGDGRSLEPAALAATPHASPTGEEDRAPADQEAPRARSDRRPTRDERVDGARSPGALQAQQTHARGREDG